jgi:hypothetical protein
MITSYQEAFVLYSACETERREMEFALDLAKYNLERATQKFQFARKGLTKAEFRTGKVRRMIKKSGFSKILQRASRVPVTRLRRTLYLFFYYFECYSQYSFRKSSNFGTCSSFCCQFGMNTSAGTLASSFDTVQLYTRFVNLLYYKRVLSHHPLTTSESLWGRKGVAVSLFLPCMFRFVDFLAVLYFQLHISLYITIRTDSVDFRKFPSEGRVCAKYIICKGNGTELVVHLVQGPESK